MPGRQFVAKRDTGALDSGRRGLEPCFRLSKVRSLPAPSSRRGGTGPCLAAAWHLEMKDLACQRGSRWGGGVLITLVGVTFAAAKGKTEKQGYRSACSGSEKLISLLDPEFRTFQN